MLPISKRIRLARETRGYSQAALSHMLGSSSSSLVTNWENGLSKPDIDKVAQMCQLLDVSPEFMLGMTNTTSPHTSSGSSAEDELQIDLSKEEISIIKKYRAIGDQGQSLIRTVLNHEYHRCTTISKEHAFPTMPDQLLPLYLCSNDPNYKEMQNKSRTLRKIKKDTGASIEGITRFLWMAGYSELISMSDVMSILRGTKVPSNELYRHIYSYLARTYHVEIPEADNQYE